MRVNFPGLLIFTRSFRPKLRHAPARPIFVLSMACIGCLYLLFLAECVMAMMRSWGGGGAIAPGGQSFPEGDFSRFWYVGRLLASQHRPGLGSAALPAMFQTNILQQSGPLYSGWLYPPTMNLLAMALSTLRLPVAYFFWNVGSLLLAAILLRYAGLAWRVILIGLCGTAALQDFVMGQNGALTGGLLVASLLLIAQKPKIAGGLAGLLSIKPQIALAFIAILPSARRRPALLACLTLCAMLIGLSLLAEGWQSWGWFIHVAGPGVHAILSTPFDRNFLAAGTTVFFMARSFHASLSTAAALQALTSLFSLWIIFQIWNKEIDDPLGRAAFTVCLAALISPYGYFYDLVGYSLAMATMFFRVPDRRKPAYGILWLAPGYSGVVAEMSRHVFMPIVLLIAAAMVWRDMRAGANLALAPRQPSSLT
jgi:hypothetical protein